MYFKPILENKILPKIYEITVVENVQSFMIELQNVGLHWTMKSLGISPFTPYAIFRS